MKLFNFFRKKKEKPLSNEDIEKEYEKVLKKVQSRNMPSLKHTIERFAEKTCSPQKGDDLLAKKADFIRYCSFLARNNRIYYSLKYKDGKFNSVSLWTQKWHDSEQKARLSAQKKWKQMLRMSKQRN